MVGSECLALALGTAGGNEQGRNGTHAWGEELRPEANTDVDVDEETSMSRSWTRRSGLGLAVVVAAALATPVRAGNGAPSGPHYNLNIIGVAKGKTTPMVSSDRHTIFVALGTRDDSVESRIYLGQGDFQVCDGNAFDAAINCLGTQIAAQGAAFQLPCNTNITTLLPCAAGDTASYEVWARGLGKPGGRARMTTCATDPITGETICSTENAVLVRNTGKSSFKNVTNELTSLMADINGDGILERVALFSGGLQDFFWQFDNQQLRLAQVRFYLLTPGQPGSD